MNKIPDSVLLCAIGYRVQYTGDSVLFSAEPGVWGCFTRMMFTRRCGCWYVELIDSGDNAVMVGHILAAMKLIENWFGGDHKFKNGEHKP